MFIHRQKQKGMVLICAVAILAVLSIMATSFVRMMTLNLQAAKNHLNYVDAKFTAIAGIEVAKAKMWEYMLSQKTSTEPEDGFWYPIYNNKDDRKLETACKNKKTISLTKLPNSYPFSYSGVVGRIYNADGDKFGRYEYNGNTYALKIKDNQGKLNLNSHRPYQNDPTTVSYNTRVENGNRVMNKIIQCLADQCGLNFKLNDNITDANIAIANKLRPVNQKIIPLASMVEVEGAIRQIITDAYGKENEILNFLNNVCINSTLDSKSYTIAQIKNLKDKKYVNQFNTEYYREYRSPVNINTASKELIAALIQAVECTAHIYLPNPTRMANSLSKLSYVENSYQYNVKEVCISFSKDKALSIATQIYNSNPTTIKYQSMAAIEEAIQNVSTSYFKSPTEGMGAYPESYNNYHKSFFDTLWYDICRDTLKTNFNPNVRENFFNPDFIYMQYVQKYNLFNHTSLTHAYSTELCFEAYGHVDIQSLGRITANNHEMTVASSIMQESIAFGSMTSLTTYNDFKNSINTNYTGDSSAEKASVFPYNVEQDCYQYRQASVGYVQAKFMENQIKTAPEICHKVHDGIIMKDIYCGNTSIASEPNYKISEDYDQFNLASDSQKITAEDIYQPTGKLTFWFKATESAYSPVFCALFSASYLNPTEKEYVPYPVEYTNNGYSKKEKYQDGIQLFIYKNTKQQLIASRLFFVGYFDSNRNNSNIIKGIKSLAVDVDSSLLPGTDESGFKRSFARVDSVLDFSRYFLANEWNRVIVTWDDRETDEAKALTLTLQTDSGKYTYGSSVGRGPNSTSKPQFCVINETNKNLTRVQINGMDRHQKSVSNTGDGRLFQISSDLHLPGNTTFNYLEKSDTSSVERSLPNSWYTVKMNFNIKSNKTDPNENPFLDNQLRQITNWGYIGPLSWIAYPEKNKVRNSSIEYNKAYSLVTTEINNSKIHTGFDDPSVRSNFSYPSIKHLLTNESNATLKCSISLHNADVHPSILDSISVTILYPYTISYSLIQ